MIRIPASKLEAGMVLAAPVAHPTVAHHVLLRADYRMEANTIQQLNRLTIEAVWIRHPGFDFLDDKISAEIPRTRIKLYEAVKRSFTGIANKTSGAFDLIEYQTVITSMIMSLIANKKNAVWAERLTKDDSDLFSHCSNVAYLSLVIGMQIKDYIVSQRKFVNRVDRTNLTNLGIGAMLHDLGKLGLDPQWHEIHFFDKDADTEDYRSHAERGYRDVSGRVEATASNILRHHHQRFDGSGFPKLEPLFKGQTMKSMKGNNIHIFSRIVAVANAMDGLMSVYQKRGLPLVAALAAIQQPSFNGMFDPVVLDAALRMIPPFPLGALVELSDGREAIVTVLNESRPCQPKVQLLHSSSPEKDEDHEQLDLSLPRAPSIGKVDDQVVESEVFYSLRAPLVRVPLTTCSVG